MSSIAKWKQTERAYARFVQDLEADPDLARIQGAAGAAVRSAKSLLVDSRKGRALQPRELHEINLALRDALEKFAAGFVSLVEPRIPSFLPLRAPEKDRLAEISAEYLKALLLQFDEKRRVWDTALGHLDFSPIREHLDRTLTPEDRFRLQAAIKTGVGFKEAAGEILLPAFDHYFADPSRPKPKDPPPETPLYALFSERVFLHSAASGTEPPNLDEVLSTADISEEMKKALRDELFETVDRLTGWARNKAIPAAIARAEVATQGSFKPGRAGVYRFAKTGDGWLLSFGKYGDAQLPGVIGADYIAEILGALPGKPVDLERLYWVKHPHEPNAPKGPSKSLLDKETLQAALEDCREKLREAKEDGNRDAGLWRDRVAELEEQIRRLTDNPKAGKARRGRDARGQRIYSVQKAIAEALEKMTRDRQPAARAFADHFTQSRSYGHGQVEYKPGRIRWRLD